MKKVVLAALVVLGTLFPVTFVPAQGNGTSSFRPNTEPMVQEVDTIVIQIVADADSVVAVPNTVTVSPGQGGRNLRADPGVVITPGESHQREGGQ